MPTTTDDQSAAPPTHPRRRALLIALFSIAAVVLVLDQASKAWALDALADGERRHLIGDLLGLKLVFNPGAALSIATGMTWLLTLVATVVIVVVVRASRRIGSRAWAVALGLLLGGALGNLVDRFFRSPGPLRGHVVDFLSIGWWPVFNVADPAVVGGAILLVALSLFGYDFDTEGRRRPEAPEKSTASQAAEADTERD